MNDNDDYTPESKSVTEIFGEAVGPSAYWQRTLLGAGRLATSATGLRLTLDDATADRYSDAQIDDYSALRGRDYPWRPPLRLTVRARASHPAANPDPRAAGEDCLRGTAGFGFWNASLSLASRSLRLPDAVWFFAASPPSNMALTPGDAGYGWKAQVVHAQRWGALAAAPPLALSALWARVSGDVRPAARWMRRLTGARERQLDPTQADLRAWHDYTLEWRTNQARFAVDGREVFVAPDPPAGPLGFVAWVDNQYAIVTPRGDLRFGALDCPSQWLELASVRIEPLT